jgi:MSHA biogenesis protein MshI
VVVLKPGGYQLIQVDAPDLPPAEWKDAIRWQLREQVGFPVEDAAIDLLEIPNAGAPRRQKALIVVAAPRAALAPLVDGAEDAGWPWSAISVSETALRNLSGLGDEPGHCQALLHLGDDQAIIVFTSGGELLHSRTIDVTLAQLAGPVGDARQLAFERASLALQRTLDGFERVNTSQPLSRMRVSPASAVADFLAFVAGLVELPIEPLDLASVLDLTAVAGVAADDRQLSPFLPAIGAALRS